MNEELYRDILGFIGRFSTTMDGKHYSNDMIEHFTCGLCYWFAYILSARFADYAPEIVLDWSKSHFACRIDGHVYDITGDIEDGVWQRWDEYDGDDREIIEDQCINF